jgi:hypothetical protein
MNLAKGKAFPASLPKAIVLISRRLYPAKNCIRTRGEKKNAGIFPAEFDAKIVNRDI